jgi:amidohydrolase
VRTLDTAVQDLVERRMREILEGVTKAAGASFTFTYARGNPAVLNHAELTAATLPSLGRVLGPANVRRIDPILGGEDFSLFANETPGFFYFLGALKPGTTSGDHHTPTFLADDGAVPVGMRAMSTILLDYLRREASRRR